MQRPQHRDSLGPAGADMDRGMTEAQLHKSVAQYLALALPKDAVWTTVGHGGGGKVRGAQLKARGLRAGWPDVQIIFRGKFYGIELKGPNGRLSPEQIACAKSIVDAGGDYTRAHAVSEVEDWLRLLRFPLRASSGPARKRARAV